MLLTFIIMIIIINLPKEGNENVDVIVCRKATPKVQNGQHIFAIQICLLVCHNMQLTCCFVTLILIGHCNEALRHNDFDWLT